MKYIKTNKQKTKLIANNIKKIIFFYHFYFIIILCDVIYNDEIDALAQF